MTSSDFSTPVVAPTKARNRAKPGELLARGVRNRQTGEVTVQFFAGEGVAQSSMALFQAFLAGPRYTILHVRGIEAEEPTSLIDELAARGYDLETFSFSVFRKGTGPVAKRVRKIQTTPGRLVARWAAVEFCGPDVCTCWERPSQRADSSLLVSFFSMGRYLSWSPGQELGVMQLTRADELYRDFTRIGFDWRTLRMKVDHRDRKPYLAALATREAQAATAQTSEASA